MVGKGKLAEVDRLNYYLRQFVRISRNTLSYINILVIEKEIVPLFTLKRIGLTLTI